MLMRFTVKIRLHYDDRVFVSNVMILLILYSRRRTSTRMLNCMNAWKSLKVYLSMEITEIWIIITQYKGCKVYNLSFKCFKIVIV